MRRQTPAYRQPKEISEEEALARLTKLCAGAEHCSGEMLEKMSRWGIDGETQARIMEYLTEHKYIDDERYSRAFVNDKVEYCRWGRRKIEQALYAKGIDRDTRNAALDAISDETFVEILRPLIAMKRKQTAASSEYEMTTKLIRFAMSRGFTMNQIRQCIDNAEEYQEDED
ncbi:MAG: regulatory protein RecX [Prevotella sp.]|uniref:regulatory protein RecX n=1 Tax=Prevotella sp. TaxID=59823 RepID=UPI002A28BD1F|nr:regulatory protein RecX [Prevotella sp.]MDD7317310.1 regulatory protein RecX [Prevotellaceae bacterium]MDY4019914.1 regulatory protein RecX [Prevotella sp.]